MITSLYNGIFLLKYLLWFQEKRFKAVALQHLKKQTKKNTDHGHYCLEFMP